MKQETKIGFADLMVSGRKIKDDFFVRSEDSFSRF